jgi:hypothetical protein
VVRDADASVEALVAAIGPSSTTAPCECEGILVGIGANGSYHAMAGELAYRYLERVK